MLMQGNSLKLGEINNQEHKLSQIPLPDDILRVIFNFLRHPSDLTSLRLINKQCRRILGEEAYTPKVLKLMSLSSIILGKPSQSGIKAKALATNNQVIAYVVDNYLASTLNFIFQGKISSFSFPYKSNEKLALYISNQFLACINCSNLKVNYFSLPKDSSDSPKISQTVEFKRRRPVDRSIHRFVDKGKFAITADGKVDKCDFNGFIEVLDTENQTLISIEDQEAKNFRPWDIILHQDIVYVAYLNTNEAYAPGVGGDNQDIIKAYSLNTKKLLHSYPCSLPKRILTDGNALIVSQDNACIKILTIGNGYLLHTIDPTINNLEDIASDRQDKSGYVRSMYLHQNKIIAGLRDCQIKIWSIKNGNLLKTFNLNLIERRTEQENVEVDKATRFIDWRMEDLTIVDRYIVIKRNVENSNLFFNIPKKPKIFILDIETGIVVHAFETAADITSLKFNQKQLVAGLSNGQVQIWDIQLSEAKAKEGEPAEIVNQGINANGKEVEIKESANLDVKATEGKPAEIVNKGSINANGKEKEIKESVNLDVKAKEGEPDEIVNRKRINGSETASSLSQKTKKWSQTFLFIIKVITGIPFHIIKWLKKLFF